MLLRGPESVLGRGDVVGGEMGHELLVDDGVEDFRDDRESEMGVVCRVGGSVEFDDLTLRGSR
jgi:hypothetical protein